ncbi:putative mitochondrial developmentally regulated phosphoprotein-like protein [Leptomonas pyrrhocoris]|uniref:Protein-serine/threonine kinase n=1 Tax=Leptomonas pyrrhocoris TaxID=157538 RepID=A0A0N0DS48_LEPPY|nr:putative mitochondrial developmentally regulated phosphoprotein-like protein [Leptomonas pyrrhocoris]KPA75398.1 putative mitochondrial developmentally regulated phosphoprotein-like protein [Leptomonas pyrrhocoris]|eukprot:XP_015653837.1 putative mitochondrial developmentally regulated phosphoprotein-like protein [Leptomonas pyrrhocoris]
MRRLLLSRTLASVCGLRCISANDSDSERLERLQEQVNGIKATLKAMEESKRANGLVRLYGTQKLAKLDIKRILAIFNGKTSHPPIFCHKTLPIVLAHFISGLDTLPAGLNAMPSILAVRGTLLRSFQKLVSCDIPVTYDQIQFFRRVLEDIDEEHAERDLLQTMAFGILELKDDLSRHRKALLELKTTSERWSDLPISEEQVLPYEELADAQAPLDAVNRSMVMYNFISRMFLNSDSEAATGEKRCKVGMVDLEINLENVVRNAVHEAKQICTDHYGDCPDAEFVITSESKMFKFPFMSTTIRYIILELMKNAFRATVEAHMKRNSMGMITCDDMPPVRVLINLQEGIEHACICISDEGKGMTEEALGMAMAYSYTSVSKPAMDLKDGVGTTSSEPSALAGYGYGLPMSRVYAQSLGGDLVLQTMEGYGTRAYYYIKIA